MGYNAFTIFNKFKPKMISQGHSKDIDYKFFILKLREHYGFTEDTAKRYAIDFLEIGYIKIDKNESGNVVNFI